MVSATFKDGTEFILFDPAADDQHNAELRAAFRREIANRKREGRDTEGHVRTIAQSAERVA